MRPSKRYVGCDSWGIPPNTISPDIAKPDSDNIFIWWNRTKETNRLILINYSRDREVEVLFYCEILEDNLSYRINSFKTTVELVHDRANRQWIYLDSRLWSQNSSPWTEDISWSSPINIGRPSRYTSRNSLSTERHILNHFLSTGYGSFISLYTILFSCTYSASLKHSSKMKAVVIGAKNACFSLSKSRTSGASGQCHL